MNTNEGKRGQRVRLTAGRPEYGLTIGETGTLTEDNDGAPFVLFDGHEKVWAIDTTCLELIEPLPVAAPQPAAPLKIEAGKFYRTRDGRKVLVDHNPHYNSAESDSYPWKHDCGYGGYRGLTENGTSCIGHAGSDLIAEWPETANVGAQVDAIAEEYGPAPTDRKLVRTGQGYGYELARFGGYVWVDIGKTAPITIRADKIAA